MENNTKKPTFSELQATKEAFHERIRNERLKIAKVAALVRELESRSRLLEQLDAMQSLNVTAADKVMASNAVSFGALAELALS